MARKALVDGKIQTENGVTTITEPFYVRELKDFTPREDGYNQELAEEVYRLISTYQALWSQNTWRTEFYLERDEDGDLEWDEYVDDISDRRFIDAEELQRQLDEMLVQAQKDSTAPTCGTAMCFAGWVGEITGADWVIDHQAIRKGGAEAQIPKSERAYFEDKVLVRKEDWTFLGELTGGSIWRESMTEPVQRHLSSRGFAKETHYIVPVDLYARKALGVGSMQWRLYGDMPVLFEGNNQLRDIRYVLDRYAEDGPRVRVPVSELPSYDDGTRGEDD